MPVFPTLATVPAEQRAAIAAQSAAPYAALTHDAFLAGSKQFMATIGTADPTLVDPSAALLATSDPAASGEWIKEILGSDYRPGLVNITVPVIEIMPYYAPDHDHPPLQYTQDQSQSFYESLLGGTPNLAVVPVSGARHFVMLDQPAAFNGALDRALHAVP